MFRWILPRAIGRQLKWDVWAWGFVI